jgi:hypothetical protein
MAAKSEPPAPRRTREDKMKSLLGAVIVGLVVVVGFAASAAGDSKDVKGDKKVDRRVFELRTYYAKPGKMKDLHARFRDHTNKLFEKHGMTIIGFWSPTDEKQAEQKLIYILAFPDPDSAKKSWAAFQNDPDWKKAKADSEKDGVLVDRVESVYMNPTDYSPLK